MRTRIELVAATLLLMIAATTVHAQRGRGHDRHDNGNNSNHNNDRRERDDRRGNGHDNNDNNHHDYDHHDYNHHDYHRPAPRVVHVYHRPAPPPRRVVYHHYSYDRPRYVYYREYDAYYDCDRQVYITYSGRNWSVSVNRPARMQYVDIYRAQRVNVSYYDDGFETYLDQRRPDGRLYGEW